MIPSGYPVHRPICPLQHGLHIAPFGKNWVSYANSCLQGHPHMRGFSISTCKNSSFRASSILVNMGAIQIKNITGDNGDPWGAPMFVLPSLLSSYPILAGIPWPEKMPRVSTSPLPHSSSTLLPPLPPSYPGAPPSHPRMPPNLASSHCVIRVVVSQKFCQSVTLQSTSPQESLKNCPCKHYDSREHGFYFTEPQLEFS